MSYVYKNDQYQIIYNLQESSSGTFRPAVGPKRKEICPTFIYIYTFHKAIFLNYLVLYFSQDQLYYCNIILLRKHI